LLFGINDGGVLKTIRWDADVDKLKHSAGTFDFDNDHITTSGNLTASGATITGCSVLGLNSAVFQPTTDSTTFFQILDADGGTPIFNVDSMNERIGIGIATPEYKLQVDYAGTENTPGFAIRNTGTGTSDDCYMAFHRDNSTAGWSVGIDSSTNDFSIAEGGLGVTVSKFLIETSTGNIGISETAPETLTEWTHATPYLTLHNSTHEDSDGGRESRLNFKGEQSGGEETTLARIEAGHDGAGDDEKGYLDIFINDGDDGDSPTKRLRIDSTGLELTGKGNFSNAGLRTVKAVDDVLVVPSDADLDTAFGTPATVGSGFIGILDDNDAGTAVWICYTTGTDAEWFYIQGTKAV